MMGEDVAESVFSYIRRQGYQPVDIDPDWYSDLSIIRFKIKGLLRKWTFGMWISTEGDCATVDFFCQHEENIDKFKPSRSFFCVTRKTDPRDKTEWCFYEIPLMLKFIKRHPLIAFAMDRNEGCYYAGSYIWFRIKSKFQDLKMG